MHPSVGRPIYRGSAGAASAIAHDSAHGSAGARRGAWSRGRQSCGRGVALRIADDDNVGGVARHDPQARVDQSRCCQLQIGQPITAQPR